MRESIEVVALRGAGRVLAGGGSVLAVLLVWLVLGWLHVFTAFLLPPLPLVLDQMAGDLISGDLAASLAQTLAAALAGFAVAAVVGTVLGIAVAEVAVVRWFFEPLISLGFPMPKIAFVPVFLLWFGPSFTTEVISVAIAVVFPVCAAATAGAQAVDRTLVWSARSLGTGRAGLLWRIVLPACVPQIFTGLQIGLPLALITTVVVEMLMGSTGLGGAMLQAMRFADSPSVFGGIIAITLLGAALVKAMEILRRAMLRWHAEATP